MFFNELYLMLCGGVDQHYTSKKKETIVILFINCVLALCLFLYTGLAKAQVAEKETAAITAAEKWLQWVAAGDYNQSWDGAAVLLKNDVTDANWNQAMKAARTPLGKRLAREVQTAVYQTSRPGAPDGEYVVIRFETAFEEKKTAIETVTPMLEKDGVWRVSGY